MKLTQSLQLMSLVILGFLTTTSTQAAELGTKKVIRMSHNFGHLSTNLSTFKDYVLTSGDNEQTEIHGLSVNGIDFSLATNCPQILPPKASCTIRIKFHPISEGFRTGRAGIELKNDSYIIDLSGWGTN